MATRWVIEPMWAGQTCVVLASGPSMSAAVADTVRPTTCRTIAVNTTFRLAPWADMIYAADAAWWKQYRDEVLLLEAFKVTCSDNPYPEVLQLREGPREGFADDPGMICTGGNSGYQAIHIAAHAGCTRILLCGFDMHGGHWHAPHKAPLRDHGQGIYAKWIERFRTLVEPLAKRGVEVINCTPGSALKVWPYMPLDVALASKARQEAA